MFFFFKRDETKKIVTQKPKIAHEAFNIWGWGWQTIEDEDEDEDVECFMFMYNYWINLFDEIEPMRLMMQIFIFIISIKERELYSSIVKY